MSVADDKIVSMVKESILLIDKDAKIILFG
jgi:hypothetical protein